MELFANVTDDLSGIYLLIPDLKQYSSIIDRAEGALLYSKMNVIFNEGTGFTVDVLKLSVNGIPVPGGMIDRFEPDFVEAINNRIMNSERLVIEELKLKEDGLVFKGEIPEAIRSMNR